MNLVNVEGSKIRVEHLERSALVYVRQSSLKQVRDHLESQRRQYGFADQAVQLGWPRERVEIIDEDQGKSGAVAQSRSGFARLVAAVARSEVGVVMSLEMSRLARNDADWSHLVYLCRWTGTLLADEQGLYDPASSTDRLVLGIRGQVSEMERDNSVHRMVEARWQKARRGEPMHRPPAGYDVDLDGRWVLTADEAVQAAIRQVFAKFDELGAARRVYLWWRDQQQPFPVRDMRKHGHGVVWKPVSNRIIYATLQHPIYAGVFAFGRSKTIHELDSETQRIIVRRRQGRAMGPWPVLLADHHPAYIDYAQYEHNQQRLHDNAMMKSDERDQGHHGAVREGTALLQGLMRCGHCARRMYVNFGGAKAARTLQYRCSRQKISEAMGEECQLVGGKRIEALVVKALLAVSAHAGQEAAELAGQQLRDAAEQHNRMWQLQIEKAQYEADRAERQYNAVEPENRVVARELERRWNASLEELHTIRAQAAARRATCQPMTAAELARARDLGRDLAVVWAAPTTTVRDRKHLLRAAIDEVQLRTTQTAHQVRIVWKGGAVTDGEVPRLKGAQQLRTADDIIEMVRTLALEFDDVQIARILNRQGHRSGLGRSFTASSVLSMRGKNKIPTCPQRRARDPHDGPFTVDQAARELGVTAGTVHLWLRQGILAGRQAAPHAPWEILLTAEVRKRLTTGDAPTGWVSLTEAARRLGISKSLAAYWVKQGKVQAMRTQVGRKACWRISVDSRHSSGQQPLFDQIGNDRIQES